MSRLVPRILPAICWCILALVPVRLHAAQAPPLNHQGLCGKKSYYGQIRTLWAGLKPVFQSWVTYSAEIPYNLYNVQGETNNLLRYTDFCGDTFILDQLAGLYLGALDTLDETDDYVFSYFPGGPRRSTHKLSRTSRMWLDSGGYESILVSSQFLYLISDALKIIAKIPAAQRTKNMCRFLTTYPAILLDHYDRWIFATPGPFQVRGWGCKVNGRYVETGMNHARFVKKKLQRSLGDGRSPSYCNGVTDTDMWIIAGAANLLAATQDALPGNIFPPEKRNQYKKYVRTGAQLLQSRITYKSLQDWSGKTVKGANFDLGAWDDHPGHAYAGLEIRAFPKQYAENGITFKAHDVGWDLSHARRFVHVFGALYANREIIGLDFSDRVFMRRLTNQFLYCAFNGDLSRPIFTNFMDGSNGWFRVNYENRTGFGYGPWDMSITALTGGYGFWAAYNADVGKLYAALLAMLSSDDKGRRTHVKKHYEHYFWNKYTHVHALNFRAKPLSIKTRRVLIQFLPSLCEMKFVWNEKKGHRLFTCDVPADIQPAHARLCPG